MGGGAYIMKEKLSVTIDERLIAQLDAMMQDEESVFRNKSHLVEVAIKKYVQEKKHGN